jgi:hypothetical protein
MRACAASRFTLDRLTLRARMMRACTAARALSARARALGCEGAETIGGNFGMARACVRGTGVTCRHGKQAVVRAPPCVSEHLLGSRRGASLSS